MGTGSSLSHILLQTLPGRLRAVREVVLWAMRLRTRHRVVNHSMQPSAEEGDYLLVNPRAYRRSRPQPGDVVVARHPFDSGVTVTKRVARVDEHGVELASDNPGAGQDSRHFGSVPFSLLRGQVTYVIR
ncbi:MAG: nickel-type superoxide dismutase maturation protease [Gammaproteobacteria bacterium]